MTTDNERQRFNVVMSAIVCLMIAVNLLFSYLFHYGGELRKIVFLPLAVGFTFACTLPALLICWEWKRKWFPMALDIGIIVAWSAAVWMLGAQMVQIAARAPFPLVDEKLAQVDSYFIQTATIVHWVEHSLWAHKSSVIAYRLLSPMAVFALFVPILIGRPDVSRRYVVSVSLSILLMLAVFAFCPAVGPWATEGFVGTKAQVSVGQYLTAVKGGNASGMEEQGDIVAFPSFHVILAVLAAVALRSVSGVRYLAVAVAVGICLSTATTGWHYVVDIAAGLGVAGTCHYLAAALLCRRENAQKLGSSSLTAEHIVT